MDDSMVCPQCSLDFNTNERVPRLLPCTHTICQECLTNRLRDLKGSLQCPVCGTQHSAKESDEFPVNEDVMQNLVNDSTAAYEDDEDAENVQKLQNTTAQRIFRATGIAVAGVVGAGAALVAAPAVLGAIGFSRSGVAAGSVAAAWMAVSGPIKAGSLYASMQSTGAAGLGLAGKTLVAGVGTAAGSGLAYLGEKFKRQENTKEIAPPNDDHNNGDDSGNKTRKSADSREFLNVQVVSDCEKESGVVKNAKRTVDTVTDADEGEELSFPVQCEEDLEELKL